MNKLAEMHVLHARLIDGFIHIQHINYNILRNDAIHNKQQQQ